MNILVTNDDGIYSQGLKVLVDEASAFGDVYVAAPTEEKSACSHGITVRSPIKIYKKSLYDLAVESYGIEGTPADCVKIAKQFLIEGKIDLVLSGVNRGANLGTDVIYSGTVAGATEGYINGIDSIAFSIDGSNITSYELAKKAIRDIISEKIINRQSNDRVLYNVNIPNISPEKFQGYKDTRLGQRVYNNEFLKRQDPWGNDYFWLGGDVVSIPENDLDYDTGAVNNNYISVTPLNVDLTDFSLLKK